MAIASKELLEEIHNRLALKILATLEDPDSKPADISNAIKFLKDNGIEQLPTSTNEIGTLLENMPFHVLLDSATD